MITRGIFVIVVSSLAVFANPLAQKEEVNSADTIKERSEKPVGYYSSQPKIFNPHDQSALSFQNYEVLSSSHLRHLFEEPEAPYSTSLPLEYQLNYSQPSRQFEFGTLINDVRTETELFHLREFANCGEKVKKQMEVMLMISAPTQPRVIFSCQGREFKLPDDLHEAVESP